LKVGIKYCGGCNPRYDRSSLVNQIVEDYKEKITFENVKEKELYDSIIVVCGCGSRCADYRRYERKSNPIIIHCELDQYDARKILNEMLISAE